MSSNSTINHLAGSYSCSLMGQAYKVSESGLRQMLFLVSGVNLQLHGGLEAPLFRLLTSSPTLFIDLILCLADRNLLSENPPGKFLGSFLFHSPFCSLPPKARVFTLQAHWRKLWLLVVVWGSLIFTVNDIGETGFVTEHTPSRTHIMARVERNSSYGALVLNKRKSYQSCVF